MAGDAFPDTSKRSRSRKIAPVDTSAPSIIKYKNGNAETVRIISRSKDSLTYHLVGEKGVTRLVKMEQVDTIVPGISDLSCLAVRDTRKSEPFGVASLVLSILGLIPIIGSIFSLLAIIFGIVSIIRIDKHTERYKNKKGNAIAGIVIGLIELVFNLFFLASIGTGVGGGMGWIGFSL